MFTIEKALLSRWVEASKRDSCTDQIAQTICHDPIKFPRIIIITAHVPKNGWKGREESSDDLNVHHK
jgi:hypothetical protein